MVRTNSGAYCTSESQTVVQAPTASPIVGADHSGNLRKLIFVNSREKCHRMTQHPPPPCLPLVNSAARVAASKTSSTPSPVRLEHSRYFRAPHSCAICSPSLGVTNFRLFLRISSIAIGSCRRSFFNPTRMIGTSGHRSLASSIHLCRTFSRLSGLSTLNPMRRTCDCA